MKIIKSPEKLEYIGKAVFLAGSIEEGKAKNWQEQIIEKLKNKDITVLNPRRDTWNSDWKQTIDNPKFREQVEWELEALEKADFIFMYFDPGTKSPVSLLEFGLYAKTGKVTVFCPEGFWKKGNIDVVCKKYNIKQVDNFELDFLK